MTTDVQTPATTSGRRRTLSRLAGGLPLAAAAALLPVLPTAPAFAADHVICVGNPAGACDATAASIPAAILAANANAVADTILVAPGTYDDGPYYLNGSLHAVTLKGSGQGATVLTLPASAGADDYVAANHATLQDLTVKLAAATSSGDTGIQMFNGSTVRARRRQLASRRVARRSRGRRSSCPSSPRASEFVAPVGTRSPTARSAGTMPSPTPVISRPTASPG